MATVISLRNPKNTTHARARRPLEIGARLRPHPTHLPLSLYLQSPWAIQRWRTDGRTDGRWGNLSSKPVLPQKFPDGCATAPAPLSLSLSLPSLSTIQGTGRAAVRAVWHDDDDDVGPGEYVQG